MHSPSRAIPCLCQFCFPGISWPQSGHFGRLVLVISVTSNILPQRERRDDEIAFRNGVTRDSCEVFILSARHDLRNRIDSRSVVGSRDDRLTSGVVRRSDSPYDDSVPIIIACLQSLGDQEESSVAFALSSGGTDAGDINTRYLLSYSARDAYVEKMASHC